MARLSVFTVVRRNLGHERVDRHDLRSALRLLLDLFEDALEFFDAPLGQSEATSFGGEE